MKLYLASSSPRRQQLLAQLGYSFDIIKPDIDETPKDKEQAKDYVYRMALEKANKGLELANMPWPILAADTIVVVDEEILGKPETLNDAQRMLRQLSGRQHQALTCVCLAHSSGYNTKITTTDVYLRAITEDEICTYWQTGEPQDKAGSYALQGIGSRFVERINGSFSGVIGLPLVETEELIAHYQQ